MFLPVTIQTKLKYILSCGNDSLESKTGATRKNESKREKTVIMVLVRFVQRLPKNIQH